MFLLLLLLSGYVSYAQQKTWHAYWIAFKDKDTSLFSVSRPQQFLSEKSMERRSRFKLAPGLTDLPVSTTYIKRLQERGFPVILQSRWLNAVTILSPEKLSRDSLGDLRFIRKISYLGTKQVKEKSEPPADLNKMLNELESRFSDSRKKASADTGLYGKSELQVSFTNTQKLHEQGFMGQGISIAVIDAGFRNANRIPFFRSLFDEKRVFGTYDFVDRETNVFNDDDHGLAVWSCMAAYTPEVLVGTAPKAGYWLLRSEETAGESMLEEAYWITALEFADSVGADIVSSSLGYNLFDDHTLDHKVKDLDGKTTIISRAAAMAASKGILLVNSAGNEGDNPWKTLAVPADAAGIITVGSVNEKGRHAAFSSAGPSGEKRIKPDVVTLGQNVFVLSASGTPYQGNGTSYSCPLIAGSLACLLQADRTKDPATLIAALQLSSSAYADPDRLNGYGIPDMELAARISGSGITQDSVLDFRWLPDGDLHLAVWAATPQKIQVEVYDQAGKRLIRASEKTKEQGGFRFPVRKTAKLDDGLYEMKVIMAGKARVLLVKK